MRTVLVIGSVILALAASVVPSEARGRRGGIGLVLVGTGGAPRPTPAAAQGQPDAGPVIRTATADPASPEPMTTGTTTRAKPREAPPAEAWCARGRVFGTGAGFCAIN
ncbi:hypothetical protein OPKNFCMD_3356 [Methylobacterium crusticola]|uniref:Uncharacterized protein n=1 Tax=Methylobacterium crusticola TaxID=1697972 RepID=A0ABQ4QZD1_9HYPH|nr:hypothetical protein [Methylobacterium crusticola]GJD50613.1 hypothetical protein OPKNFCMD_3356 [Methylobacterium crusticola]